MHAVCLCFCWVKVQALHPQTLTLPPFEDDAIVLCRGVHDLRAVCEVRACMCAIMHVCLCVCVRACVCSSSSSCCCKHEHSLKHLMVSCIFWVCLCCRLVEALNALGASAAAESSLKFVARQDYKDIRCVCMCGG